MLGGAGGVGTFAVQFAKLKGAKVVATVRGAAQEAHLRTLGADTILDIAKHGLADAGQVDAVLDLVGGDLLKGAWSHVKKGGVVASTMGPPSEEEAKTRGARTVSVFTKTDGAQLAEIAKAIDTGAVKVVVSEQLPLEHAQKAYELLEKGGVRGKVVLTIGR